MKYLKPILIPGLAILLASMISACSDDDSTDNGSPDASADDDTSDDDTSDDDTSDDDTSDDDTSDDDTSDDDTSDDDTDAGMDATEDAGAPENDGGTGGSPYATLPTTLSLTGCSGIGPLCTLVQTDGEFTANCAGVQYLGEVTEDGNVTLTAEPDLTDDGEMITWLCDGELSNRGQLIADCTVTTVLEDDTELEEECELQSDPELLPSVECMELPSELSAVEICVEGAEAGGETLSAGTCSVVQDGCSFQADCEDGTTLAGDVSMTGISFSQTLAALADAETPTDGGDPQFLEGALVPHNCSATLDGTTLAGECAAGRAGRGGTNTSVCSIDGSVDQLAECENLSPAGNEQIFALDSCDALKNGEGGEPGIGEPLCAFRQTNCIWELQCGRALTYTGRVEPGDTDFDWRLETGTQCEGSFDGDGEFSGICAVPDLFSCDLSSMEAQPGGDECPSAPIGEEVTSRGCGNGSGDAMVCRELMWHGCDFMAICSFSFLETLVFAGEASEDNGVGQLDFNGIADWSCHVAAPSEDDLESDPYRASNEWLGQCETAEGGLCRDNFDPATGEGFRGLQLFWGEAEPEPQPDAGAPDAGSGADAGE